MRIVNVNNASNLSALLAENFPPSKNYSFPEKWIESGRLIRSIAVPASLGFALQHLFSDNTNKNRNIFIFLFSTLTYLARAAIVFGAPIFLSNALESVVNNLAHKKERNQNDIALFSVALFCMLPLNYFLSYARSLSYFEPLAKKDFKAALMQNVVSHNNNLSLDVQVDEPKEVMTTMIVRIANRASFVVPAFSSVLSGIVASTALLVGILRLSDEKLRGLEAGKFALFTLCLFYNSYRSQQKLVSELDAGLDTILFVRAKADENKLIQLNVMEKFELAQAKKIIDAYCKRTQSAEHQDSINRARVWLVVGAFSCAMVGYLLNQYAEGRFSFSKAIQLIFYLVLQAFELSMLSMQADTLATALTELASVFGYLRSPVQKINRSDAVALTLDAAPSIEFDNVCFDYYRNLKIHCIESNTTISDSDSRMDDVRCGQAIFLIHNIKTDGYAVGFAKPAGYAIEKLSMNANIEIGIYLSKIKGPLDDRSPFFGFVLRLLLPVIHAQGGIIPRKHLIENLSFKVTAGEKTVIVGSTGCGKSTLISLLSRFYEPVRGEIKIDGVPIQHFTTESLRKLTAVISQDTKPFDATVRENILYANDGAIVNEALMHYIDLPAFFCDRRAGIRSGLLSGGQGQRINVLRALHKIGARIVLADEPTTYLDDETAKKVQKVINQSFSDKTVLQISHNILVTFCDELEDIHRAQATRVICFLDNGEFETGTVYDLINKPNSEFFRRFKISCAESEKSFEDITRGLQQDARPSGNAPF